MPDNSTTSSWLFPPQTREVQFDEKWSFVEKKEHHCDPQDPEDARKGDHWDHVALDPVHRLVVSVVPGKRTAKNLEKLVRDFKRRTRGRLMDLITSDEYRPYKGVILKVYGRKKRLWPWGKRGRVPRPRKVPLKGLKYAVVHKTRKMGRVVKVALRVVFGDKREVKAALRASPVSSKINTAFVERHNATDRHRNGRKVRKTYCFSKDWAMHEAMTYFTMYSYNFCWPVRTLRRKGPDGRWQPVTPAMAAGLADHLWSLDEWLTYPVIQYK
jgi:IS1 family transposase